MKTIALTKTVNGEQHTFDALCNDRLLVVLDHAKVTGRGQFAFIENHVSGITSPNCITPRVSDKWVCVHPRYDLYLQRKLAALGKLTFDDILPLPQHLLDKAKHEGTDAYRPLFEEAMAAMTASTEGSIGGHDTRTGYASYEGVTVHLRTGKEGKKTILMADVRTGLPIVDSVMLYWYPISEREHVKGEYKPVDSHALTRMKDHIESIVVARSWRCLSLGLDNFTALHINGKAILGKVNDMLSATSDAELAKVFREVSFIAQFGTLTPLEKLEQEATQEVTQNA